MTDIITTVTLESLRDLVQQAGYRVEIAVDQAGVSVLRSATAGMWFELRPGSKLPDGGHVDFSLITALPFQGEPPLALVNQWNVMRRFGRLYVDRGFLLLTMDVMIAGGITSEHLRAQIAIWDQLIQELMPYLRAEAARLAAAGAQPSAAAPSEPAASAAA